MSAKDAEQYRQSQAGKSDPYKTEMVPKDENFFHYDEKTGTYEADYQKCSQKYCLNSDAKTYSKVYEGLDEAGNTVYFDDKGLKVDNALVFVPDDGGVPGTHQTVTLEPGTVFDRYGSPEGTYTSPEGTPYDARSLAYSENPNAYHKYEVLKPLDSVVMAEVAPAFGCEGGGTQYHMPLNMRELIELGYIKEVFD